MFSHPKSGFEPIYSIAGSRRMGGHPRLQNIGIKQPKVSALDALRRSVAESEDGDSGKPTL
jgi:hypothetical protein